jgi:hypothetical protein
LMAASSLTRAATGALSCLISFRKPRSKRLALLSFFTSALLMSL